MFHESPVEADTEHPIVAQGGDKQVDIFPPLPHAGQRAIGKGYLAHPVIIFSQQPTERDMEDLHLSLFARVSGVE